MPSSAGNLHPSQKKVDKIKSQEDAKEEEEVAGKNKYLKENSHSSFLQSSSPNPQVALNSVLKKSQSPTFHGMMISFKSNNNQV